VRTLSGGTKHRLALNTGGLAPSLLGQHELACDDSTVSGRERPASWIDASADCSSIYGWTRDYLWDLATRAAKYGEKVGSCVLPHSHDTLTTLLLKASSGARRVLKILSAPSVPRMSVVGVRRPARG